MPINIDHRQNLIVTDDSLLNFNMTGSVTLPSGTTGQRPGTPSAGMIRYNSTLATFEGYITDWEELGGLGSNIWTDNGTDVYYNGGLDVGIGVIAPDATLHVREGAYSPVWSYFSAMQFISERDNDNSWVLGSGAGNSGTIYFADTDDVDIGAISYDHNTNELSFRANNNSELVWTGTALLVNTPTGATTGIIRTLGGIYDYASSGNGGFGGFQAALSTGGASFRAYSGSASTDTFIDFDSYDITSGDFQARLFRNTNTSGIVRFLIFGGDGTSTTNYQFDETNAQFRNSLTVGDISTPSVTLDIQGTDAVQLPNGTTGERPTPAVGMIRYNSTEDYLEGYTTAGGWSELGAGGSGSSGSYAISLAMG